MTAAVKAVAHTGITVSDIARAARFFRDVLGAAVTEPVFFTSPIFARITGVDGANIRIAYVELPGHKLELLEYTQPEKRRTSDLRPCDAGHMHLSLLVDGIEDLAERLRAGGFVPVGPVQEVLDDGGVKAIYTCGFDGVVIELMHVPHKQS